MELILSNNHQQLHITNTIPYVLQSFDTSVDIEHYESKGISQDGVSVEGNTLSSRSITIECTLCASSEKELSFLKRRLITLMNPKLRLELTYKGLDNKKIEVAPVKLPYFSPIGCLVCKCLLNFTCFDPYWRDAKLIAIDIAKWINGFSFPCEFHEEGIELGYRSPEKIVNIVNEGDSNCDLVIRLRARGNVVNPNIMNINTNETIALNTTMRSGEVIEICTEYGNKYISSTKDGTTTSIWAAKDHHSVFFPLYCGDNPIRYDADENVNSLDVSIYFRQKYLEVY